MVRIDVMGPFTATRSDGAVAFQTRSAAAVVAYAALARGRPVPRNAVSTALWPEREPASARTNLRKAVQRVRQALPESEILLTPGGDLLLDTALVETDLDRADRLHRTFVLATRQPEGTAALAQEWEIRRRTLLEGWEDAWIEPLSGARRRASERSRGRSRLRPGGRSAT